MSVAFCQTGHPPGFFSFYFYPPVAHSRFSCFTRIWDFSFYSEDPVPVGFEPVRRLRPQPIPFLWGRSLPQEQSYPELLMSLVSDCAQAWTSRPPAPGYFQSECELTSGPGLLPCRSYSLYYYKQWLLDLYTKSCLFTDNFKLGSGWSSARL